MLFDRWRQRVVPRGHFGASWRILVHPSAHSSPQPKRQMDRFSRFCTAYGTKCLYFTMGAPIHQSCPFPRGIWTSHVTHDALGPCEPQPKRYLNRFRRVSTDDRRVTLYGLPVSPSKLFLPMLALGPPDSGTQMATYRFSHFCRAH